MKKNIILVGKAASGKDYFKNFLLSEGFKTSVSHTTRPKREGEEHAKDYFFVDRKEFLELINEERFFEYKDFNGWYYGTSENQVSKSNVFIYTPSGIKDLPKEFLAQSIIIYFDISLDERIKRLHKRSDSDTIERRVIADEQDFKSFDSSFYNIKVNESNFECKALLNKIKQYK